MRERNVKQLLMERGRNLHLGCGDRSSSGWLNVDANGNAGVDLQWDLREPLPFDDSSCRLIYSEHLLEHLMKEDGEELLAECYRLLEPGGRLRIGVPDAELYLRSYVEGRAAFFNELAHLGGAVNRLSTPIDVINQMFRMGGAHRFAWDFEALMNSLRRAGFDSIQRFSPGEASSPKLCLDDPEHAFETLYVEAIKA
ncbi:MAG TPA: methyltransferase domain-containing protein [Pyrinomonadaceae bacterium]